MSDQSTSTKSVRQSASKIKNELVCRKCGAFWSYHGTSIKTYCPFCGSSKDARDRRDYAKRYNKAHERKIKLIQWSADPDHVRERSKKSRQTLKKRVFFRICGSINPRCVRCGCDDDRLLEINHKNGGGSKEMQHGRYTAQFRLDIATGRRNVDDLELLCKPCNAIHALELKYGKLSFVMLWKENKYATA